MRGVGDSNPLAFPGKFSLSDNSVSHHKFIACDWSIDTGVARYIEHALKGLGDQIVKVEPAFPAFSCPGWNGLRQRHIGITISRDMNPRRELGQIQNMKGRIPSLFCRGVLP